MPILQKALSLIGLLFLLFACQPATKTFPESQEPLPPFVCDLIPRPGIKALRKDKQQALLLLDSLPRDGRDAAFLHYYLSIGVNDFTEKENLLTEAIHRFEALDSLPVALVGKLYKNLASAANEYPLARRLYADAGIALLQRYADSCVYSANLLPELHQFAAEAALDVDDIVGALHYASAGIKYCRANSASPYALANLHRTRGRGLLEAGQIDAAVAALDSVEYTFGPLDELTDPNDRKDLVSSYEDRQELARLLGDELRAQKYAQQAYDIRTTETPGSPVAANARNNLGRILLLDGRFQAGEREIRRALSFYENHGTSRQRGTSYESLALGAIERNDTITALNYLDKAIDAYHGNSAAPSLANGLDKSELRDPLYDRARLLAGLHRSHPNKVALEDVRLAVSRVDSINAMLRVRLRTEANKRRLLRQTRSLYDCLLGILIDRQNSTGNDEYLEYALELLASGKAIVLNENRAVSLAAPQTERTAALVAEEARALQLERVKGQLANANDPQLIQRLSTKFLRLEAEDLRAREAVHQKVTPPTLRTTKPKVLESLTAALSDSAALLDYFIGESAVYVAVGYRGRVSLRRLAISPYELASTVMNFRKAIAARNDARWSARRAFRDQQTTTLASSASHLYRHLVAEAFAPDQPPAALTIIPDGEINLLPFEALLTDTTDTADFNRWPFAVNRHTFNYHFSATVWSAQRNQSKGAQGELLVVAPEQPNSRKVAIPMGDSILLTPLTVTDVEVATITTHATQKVTLWKGTEATRFRDPTTNLKAFGIIHFTGHGVAMTAYPDRSFLALNLSNAPQPPVLLTVSALARRQIATRLLVLSACQTNAGTLDRQEGILSLARAGILAGADAVVASRWPVRQIDKPPFFDCFYGVIAQDGRRDEAIRAAQLKVMHTHIETAHPYYWAGFHNLGLGGPIQ